MKLSRYVLGVIASSFLAFCHVSQAQTQEPLIHVQGSGATSITPNAYTVTLVMEAHGENVAPLNQILSAEMRSVISFLLKQDIKQSNIQSMQVRLNPRYTNTPQGRQQDGFTLSREIVVTDTDIENYDRVLDGVLKRGVDRIQQFNFVSAGENNAYQTALIAAVADAKARATLLAKELGVEVGEVVAISESGGNMPVPVMRADAFAKESVTSLPGQKTVEARINVSFRIIQ
ncbi:DUF541 domain-containing protein [Alteromonas sp. 345S023]|uniref:DUF541 domain-containing protein n=1 Tax=Alteromonas profundi TaxID=2696062 RepID=A0A7X5LKZ7_9ALTE|nr:SIMPL domain-containing protein [Alteromonas profundi]NDV91283.1 DUF541 domain-containing protein [Alteromonas profundi]